VLERGLVQIYTGDGKGKTTAALGAAVRAVGHGLRVCFIQFMKGSQEVGEFKAAQRLAPELQFATYGRAEFDTDDPDWWKKAPTSEDLQAAAQAFRHACECVNSGERDVVVMDEISHALGRKLITVDEVLELLAQRPAHVEVILTGRQFPPELVEVADLVTEMREIKHWYRQEMPPRRGIEY
jgi:cob(I)alamin adenosyltransferase